MELLKTVGFEGISNLKTVKHFAFVRHDDRCQLHI